MKKIGALPPQQAAVLAAISDGMTNKEIARHVGIADGTVSVHLRTLFLKFRVTTRTALLMAALHSGHLSLQQQSPPQLRRVA